MNHQPDTNPGNRRRQHLETMAGAEVIVFDHSARLRELARMPGLKGHTRVVNLFHGESGRLSPYKINPAPKSPARGTNPDSEPAMAAALPKERHQ